MFDVVVPRRWRERKQLRVTTPVFPSGFSCAHGHATGTRRQRLGPLPRSQRASRAPQCVPVSADLLMAHKFVGRSYATWWRPWPTMTLDPGSKTIEARVLKAIFANSCEVALILNSLSKNCGLKLFVLDCSALREVSPETQSVGKGYWCW